MPPQSRGGVGGDATSPGHEVSSSSYSRRTVSPPTLQPYLGNRPISPDLPTPTGPRPLPPVDRETPTPTPKKSRKTSFVIGAPSRAESQGQQYDRLLEGQNGESTSQLQMNGEDDSDEDEDEDDEFDSHYSRQSSSPSSSVVSGLEMNGGDHFGNIEEESEDDDDDDDDDEEGKPGNRSDNEEHIDEDEEKDPPVQQHLHNTSKSARQVKPNAPLHRVASLPASASAVHLHPHNIARPPLYTSRSTTSLPPAPPPPLFPPFYNRPPTPLPPSPSLTSLLRPPSLLNRSATSTRPTTPEDSDAETPNDTEAAVAQSARRAHPLPPTSPKVPTYEYYGFVLHLASSFMFLMYLLWSYLPSPFLHALGITYYPNRWWSLAIPAWIVMGLIWIYVALLSYNVEHLTLPMNSLGCMVDDAGNVAVLDENMRIRRGGSKKIIAEFEMLKKDRAVGKKDPPAKIGRGARKSDHLINGASSILYQNHAGQYSYDDGTNQGKAPGTNRTRNNNNRKPTSRNHPKDGDLYAGTLTRTDSTSHQNYTGLSNSNRKRSEFKDPWELELEDSLFRGYLGRDLDMDEYNDDATDDEEDEHEDEDIDDNDEENKNNVKDRKSKRDGDGDRSQSRSTTGRKIKRKEFDWFHLWNEGTDAVMDVPIAGVCEILYGDHY